jgi:hypothetical protein
MNNKVMSCFSFNNSCKHCEIIHSKLFDINFEILNTPQGKVEKKNLRNLINLVEVKALTEWTTLEFLNRFQSTIDQLVFILRSKWWMDKCRIATTKHIEIVLELFELTLILVELYIERRKNFESETKYIRINEYIIEMAKEDFEYLKNLNLENNLS